MGFAAGIVGIGSLAFFAYSYLLSFEYGVGLDMTRRDLQSDMREKKRPWDIGKSFADAAPIGPIP